MGRAPRAAQAPAPPVCGEHQRCSWRDLPPLPLTGIGSFSLGKGDLRVPPASLYPLRSSVRLQSSQLPLKNCFSAAPRTEVLQELPRDPKHPCKRRAGRQPCSSAGQGPRPRERQPEPCPGHPGGSLPGDVSHPAGRRRALSLHQGGGTCLRIV